MSEDNVITINCDPTMTITSSAIPEVRAALKESFNESRVRFGMHSRRAQWEGYSHQLVLHDLYGMQTQRTARLLSCVFRATSGAVLADCMFDHTRLMRDYPILFSMETSQLMAILGAPRKLKVGNTHIGIEFGTGDNAEVIYFPRVAPTSLEARVAALEKKVGRSQPRKKAKATPEA